VIADKWFNVKKARHGDSSLENEAKIANKQSLLAISPKKVEKMASKTNPNEPENRGGGRDFGLS
jgi:hypothetical protein